MPDETKSYLLLLGHEKSVLRRPADPFVLEFIRAQRSILAERMAAR